MHKGQFSAWIGLFWYKNKTSGIFVVLVCNNYQVDLFQGSRSNEGNNQMEQNFKNDPFTERKS